MTGLIRTTIIATMLLALPAGALSSAVPHADIMTSQDYRFDHYRLDDFRPGQDGIDYTIITGPTSSQSGRLPACADPARRGNLRPC